MDPCSSIKPVTETFKEKMMEQIENEKDENRKEILVKAFHRGVTLLEGG